jgi:hypothetical protein
MSARALSDGKATSSSPRRWPLMDYRLYALNKQGRIIGPPSIIKAETDEGAIAEAKGLRRNLDRELRQDARLVIMLKASIV